MTLGLIGVAFTGASYLLVPRILPAAPRFAPLGLILIAGGGIGWWFQRRQWRGLAAGSLVGASLAFFTALLIVVVGPMSHLQNGPLVGEAMQRLGIADSAPLAKFDVHLDGLDFYGNRRVEELFNTILVQNYFADHHDGVLVTNSVAWEQLRTHLPQDVVAVDRQPHFGRHDEIIVVARLPDGLPPTTAAQIITANRQDADRLSSEQLIRR